MTDQQIFDGLFNVFNGHAAWPTVIGAVVLALCALTKIFLTGKVHGQAKAWTFAVVGTVFVGASVAAGGGTDWVRGTIIALIGGFISTGLLDLVKEKIPDIGKPSNQPPPLPVGTTTTSDTRSDNDRITPKETPVPHRPEEPS